MVKGLEALAAAGLLALSGYRVLQGGLLSTLLASQTTVVAVLLLIRRAPAQEASWVFRLLAWLSAGLPVLMQPGAGATWPAAVQIAGLIIAIWAKASLGRSFGIAPADRGLRATGPYLWLRHPAYAGELLSFAGVWASAPTIWNTALLLLIGVSLLVRIAAEESVMSGYPQYAARVRWRLVPGVW